MFSDLPISRDDAPPVRGVLTLEPDAWTERRRALSTAAQWLRSQEWEGAFDALPQYAATFLETFQADLREQLRWEESVPFPYVRSLLEGHFARRVEGLVAEHNELRRRLEDVVATAQAGVADTQLSTSFGAELRCFLDVLERHNEREAELWEKIRPAADLREWPDGPDRSSSRTGAFA